MGIAFAELSGSRGDFMSGMDKGQPAKSTKLLEQMPATLRVLWYAGRSEPAQGHWHRRLRFLSSNGG